ncbi:hypothetical protein VTK56DRAFT_309 [Thermocarpiscus australiensis]
MSPTETDEGLRVIALVSGGKDSFFSLLHCRANGHRIVALANLHPALSQPLGPSTDSSANNNPALTINVNVNSAAAAAPVPVGAVGAATSGGGPNQDLEQQHGQERSGAPGNEVVRAADEDERDLNSFMYQTVGHQVIPLYADATGIPLYRRAITGGATQHGKDYSHYRRSAPASVLGSTTPGPDAGRQESQGGLTRPPGASASAARHAHEDHDGAEDPVEDETESMVPLLEAVKAAHPEANAICAGAILSTYQRTRVESVATRLGLIPLAYLWKFPVLPVPGPSDPAVGSDAQLLDDMAAAGLEARIIKVASGGLDDSFLWTNVASAAGKAKLARAMRRFGAAETGAVIGEGGEFETLVLDGPSTLFRKRIVVAEEDRRVVREGGGSAWLMLRNAKLEVKGEENVDGDGKRERARIPDLLDPKFASMLDVLSSSPVADDFLPLSLHSGLEGEGENPPQLGALQDSASGKLQQWCFVSTRSASAAVQAQAIVDQIRQRLKESHLPPSAILSATVVLRRMIYFPLVNSYYGALFDAPNPPSRVTISCGDALSAAAAGADIAIYLTVHTALQPGQRQGLHVQSRSYWAPANIGPYSQAISVPLASLGSGSGSESGPGNDPDDDDTGARLVTIAGQIPLVPATMALPVPNRGADGDEDTLRLQIALSLQHLWRIGADMGVQWWTSAVAYFPRCDVQTHQMPAAADLAARAWKTAHLSPDAAGEGEDEDEDNENGPDLWDRKFNPQFRHLSLAGDYHQQQQKQKKTLPDRSVLGPAAASTKTAVPALLLAEVDELPRGAGIEWHAHGGIAHADAESVAVVDLRDMPLPVSDDDDGSNGAGKGVDVVVSQVIVKSRTRTSFVQTVVAERYHHHRRDGTTVPSPLPQSRAGLHGRAAKAALARLGEVGSLSPSGAPAALVRYVDAEFAVDGLGPGPVVPCRSLWDDEGGRLAAVTVYQSVFERGRE